MKEEIVAKKIEQIFENLFHNYNENSIRFNDAIFQNKLHINYRVNAIFRHIHLRFCNFRIYKSNYVIEIVFSKCLRST